MWHMVYMYRLRKTCLNEIGIMLHENVCELISRVNLVKQRIYVIILNKVTVPSTNKMYSTRYD